MNTPDLYTHFQLDRQEDSAALGLLLSAKDLELQNLGLEQQDLRRQQVQTAFSVLGHEGPRQLYDTALQSGRQKTWADLYHLGYFGSWPVHEQPQPQPQPQPQYQQTQTAQGQRQFYDFQQAPHQGGPVQRATQIQNPETHTRAAMAIVDLLIAGTAASVVSTLFFWAPALSGLLFILIFLGYHIGFEVKTGSTPAKKFFGYQVRDARTKQHLTWTQSAKRQWWRLATVVPGVGSMISVIAAIYYTDTINKSVDGRGDHDRWAEAEVVKVRR